MGVVTCGIICMHVRVSSRRDAGSAEKVSCVKHTANNVY